MSHKIKITRLIILLLTIALPFTANAQLLKKGKSKKELKTEIEKLTKELDSLRGIIEGGAIELSDTTLFEEAGPAEEYNFTNSHIFEDAQPGCNPDSLLEILYNERNIPMDRYIIESDSVELFSNIPDSIYIAKIKKMNSFIPIPYNHVVRNQIIAYTEKMPTFSNKVLGHSKYYQPIFEEIFDY
ncbi:MAG: hypothetical protein IIW25_03590, partial [Bacteroidales bacterium]|nr:hypothetical protein [Bacteroidales bacterium]